MDEATAAEYARAQREHDEAHRRAHGGAERRPLSRGRVYGALLALALGGFGIGSTEFVAMGLLPEIARDLLPGLYAANTEEAIGQSGWVITAYALGVVVGAPTIAAFAGRVPRRRLLLWLAAAFTLGTVASATLPTFELVIAARFMAGLPHGAYFGVAALVAASLMGPGKRGQGVALVLSGLTVATVIGVPLITAVGQAAGWRAAYLVVAALFAATFVAVRILVPWQPGDANSTVRRELAAFGSLQVWVAVAVGAIGFGGFFAVYSYIAPMVTDSAGMPGSAVPWFAGLIGSLALLGLAGTVPVGLIAGTFLVGFTASIMSPVIQTRLMDVAGESQTLAAALNHSALNVGNALGAFLGGLVVAAGWGYLTPAWVGLLLAFGGVMLAIVSVALERRTALVA
ncbi:MAG: arabinose ABC transporter permease [Micrococcales bacterium 32-70-13]|nr:MAG: arabinose ABC transporter permease [Micrococcales bacterium 32-70-13]